MSWSLGVSPAEQRCWRLRGRSSLGRRAQQPLFPAACSSLWKRPIFSPKRLLRGTCNVCSLSLAKAKPYPVLSAPLGFPGTWLLRLPHFHRLSTSFFPLLPSSAAVASLRPPHGPAAPAAPLNGPRGRIIGTAHLHPPSSRSCPAPPPPADRRSSAGARPPWGAGRAAGPGLP